MKPQIIFAFLLVVIGIVTFAYQGFSYSSTEKAIDLGPIQVSVEKTHTFPIPPIFGGIVLVSGILLLVLAGRKA